MSWFLVGILWTLLFVAILDAVVAWYMFIGLTILGLILYIVNVL